MEGYSTEINEWMDDLNHIMDDVLKDCKNIQKNIENYNLAELLLHFGHLDYHSTELVDMIKEFVTIWKKKYNKIVKILKEAEDVVIKIDSIGRLMYDYDNIKSNKDLIKTTGISLKKPVREVYKIIQEAINEYNKEC